MKIVGDLHGIFDALRYLAEARMPGELEQLAPGEAVVQVGDFGFYEDRNPAIEKLELVAPVYAADGNHEDHSQLDLDAEEPYLYRGVPNLYYVPRGRAVTIEGRRVGFLGGASSVDKFIRLNRGLHWSPREVPSAEQVARLMRNEPKLDILITHCPPQSVIDRHFDPQDLNTYFGLPVTWLDPTASMVEVVWNFYGRPPLYCGHMHRSVTHGNVRILDIEEVVSA